MSDNNDIVVQIEPYNNLTNKKIVERPVVSAYTVKIHLKNIFFGIDTNNSSGAIAKVKKLRFL